MKCLFCGKKLTGRLNKKYCNKKCMDGYWNNKQNFKSAFPYIAYNNVGRTSSEYVQRLKDSRMLKEQKETYINNYLNTIQGRIINHFNG